MQKKKNQNKACFWMWYISYHVKKIIHVFQFYFMFMKYEVQVCSKFISLTLSNLECSLLAKSYLVWKYMEFPSIFVSKPEMRSKWNWMSLQNSLLRWITSINIVRTSVLKQFLAPGSIRPYSCHASTPPPFHLQNPLACDIVY